MGVIARMVVVAVLVAVLTVSMTLKQKGYGMAGIDIIKAIQEMFTKESNPQQDIINILKDKGYSDKAIAGILGNIELETGGSFDYTQKEDEGEAYGLFQFDPNGMLPYYNKYLDENDLSDSIQSQIDFMDDVTKGNVTYYNEQDEKNVPILGYGNVNKLQESFEKDDVGEIAKDFNTIFEKGKMKTDYGNREDLANEIYKEYF